MSKVEKELPDNWEIEKYKELLSDLVSVFEIKTFAFKTVPRKS